MKGVILAGGLGTRLHPLTRVTNKHLLPVFDRPMIYYPLQTLINAGIEHILIVTGGNNAGDFLRLLGNGKEFGLKHLNYTYQEGEGGIAAALVARRALRRRRAGLRDPRRQHHRAQHPARGGRFRDARRAVRRSSSKGCRIRSASESRCCAARASRGSTRSRAGRRAAYAVTGIYMYDAAVFDVIRELKPSGRGELEITDVNNWYIAAGTMTYEILRGLVDRRRHVRVARTVPATWSRRGGANKL